MKKIVKIPTLLIVSTTMLLTSCGPAYYIENEYCRTNMDSISETSYPIVGQVKQIQPYKMNPQGQLTANNVNKVYPFDTNLIYTLYASKYLKSHREVMEIESITGKYTADLHKLFDRHYYYIDENNKKINNLKVINDSYGSGEWIKVDNRLIEVLKLSIEATKISKGKFNLFIGELSDFWNGYIEENEDIGYIEINVDPDQTPEGKEALQTLVKNTPSWDEIDNILEIDESNNQVRFNKYYTDKSKDEYAPKVSISLGGIGKGYLSENNYQRLKEKNYTYGVYYAGASSIVFMGPSAYNSPWTIELSNPYGYVYSPIGHLSINEKMSLSTSGAQVQYYYAIVDGQTVFRHHIIDSNTGYPLNYYNQVTLISKSISSATMDALSTVLINCPLNEVEETIKSFRQYYNSDLECILYKKTNVNNTPFIDAYITNGLKNYFSEYTPSDESISDVNYIPCNYYYLEY